jgi:hypothetical protein
LVEFFIDLEMNLPPTTTLASTAIYGSSAHLYVSVYSMWFRVLSVRPYDISAM